MKPNNANIPKHIVYIILFSILLNILSACTNEIKEPELTGITETTANSNALNSDDKTVHLKFKENIGADIDTENGIKLLYFTTMVLTEYSYYKRQSEKFGPALIEIAEPFMAYIPNNSTQRQIHSSIQDCYMLLLELGALMSELEGAEIERKFNIGNISEMDIQSIKDEISKTESALPVAIDNLVEYFELSKEFRMLLAR